MHKCHFLGCFWGLAKKKSLLRKRKRQTTTKPNLTLKFSHIPCPWIWETPWTTLHLPFWWCCFDTHTLFTNQSRLYHQHFPMCGLKQALPFHPKKPQLAALIVHRVSTELADGTWDGHALKRFYYKKKASQLCSPTSQNHKITRVGRDPHGSSSPTPGPAQDKPKNPTTLQ